MRRSSALRVFAGLGLAALAAPALAADLPERAAPPVFTQPDPGYTITIGIGPNVTNQFPGSRSIWVIPAFHLDYRKVGEPERFYAPDDAFDIGVYQNQYVRIGPAANFISSRGLSGGNANFYGLHYIGNTVELGGFVEVFPVPNHLRLRGEVLQGVTGSKGLVGNVAADAFTQLGPVQISAGPRFGFGNQRYFDQYFTVLPYEAAANGLVNPYKASAGLASIGGLGTIRYDISPAYYVQAFGGYSRLVDSAGMSPVSTRLGSRNQFTAGATINYRFAFKGFGVLGF